MLGPRDDREKAALAIVCPITSNTGPYPLEVMLPQGLAVSGAALSGQVKSIGRAARQLTIAGRAPQPVVFEVQAKIAALLGIDDA